MLQDRRVVIAAGAAGALLLGLLFAVLLLRGGSGTTEAPPASQGGLQVSVTDPGPPDPARPLRCFVDGRYVGMATVAECAERNGVSAQALDVGLDESGQLAAAATGSLAPPPGLPDAARPLTPLPEPVTPAVDGGPTAPCLRYIGAEWRQIAEAVTLGACVRTLYDGRCERPGGAQYGRWAETTLRLVPGRVERSADNVNFTTLVEQGRGCSVAALR
jgi:hypothetical protein